MSNRRNISILPDSTVRKMMLRSHLELPYNGAGGNTFNVGDTVTGFDSGAIGTVGKAIVTDANTGVVILTLDSDTKDSDLAFTSGENLQVEASTIAQANGVGTDIYVQPMELVSTDNPDNGVKIEGFYIFRSTSKPFKIAITCS